MWIVTVVTHFEIHIMKFDNREQAEEYIQSNKRIAEVWGRKYFERDGYLCLSEYGLVPEVRLQLHEI